MARSHFTKSARRTGNADLEAIAQRGPWGHTVTIPDPVTGKPTKQRVSFQGLMRRIASERAPQPVPRADKGVAYSGGGYKTIMSGGKERVVGIPRVIVRA